MQKSVSVDVARAEIVKSDGVGRGVQNTEHLDFRAAADHHEDGNLAAEALDGNTIGIGRQQERNNRVTLNVADAEHLMEHSVAEAGLLLYEFRRDPDDALNHREGRAAADGYLKDAVAVAIAERTQRWSDLRLGLGKGHLHNQRTEPVQIVIHTRLLSSLIGDPSASCSAGLALDNGHLRLNKCVFANVVLQSAVSKIKAFKFLWEGKKTIKPSSSLTYLALRR